HQASAGPGPTARAWPPGGGARALFESGGLEPAAGGGVGPIARPRGSCLGAVGGCAGFLAGICGLEFGLPPKTVGKSGSVREFGAIGVDFLFVVRWFFAAR